MTANFGPDAVKELLKAKESRECEEKREQLEKHFQQAQREQAENEEREAQKAKIRADNKARDKKRAVIRGNFIITVTDWIIENLQDGIKDGIITPTVSDHQVELSFVLHEEFHGLADFMRKALIDWLTERLQKDWDTVHTSPVRDQWDDFVGIRFSLSKRS